LFCSSLLHLHRADRKKKEKKIPESWGLGMLSTGNGKADNAWHVAPNTSIDTRTKSDRMAGGGGRGRGRGRGLTKQRQSQSVRYSDD